MDVFDTNMEAAVLSSSTDRPPAEDCWLARPQLTAEMIDYNQEGSKLLDSRDGSRQNRFNNLDPIFRSEAGGFIYVGGDLVSILS